MREDSELAAALGYARTAWNTEGRLVGLMHLIEGRGRIWRGDTDGVEEFW